MKNSGLFLNMVKSCFWFVFEFFLCFVVGFCVFGKVAKVLKMFVFTIWGGFVGWFILVYLGLEGLGCFCGSCGCFSFVQVLFLFVLVLLFGLLLDCCWCCFCFLGFCVFLFLFCCFLFFLFFCFVLLFVFCLFVFCLFVWRV